MEARKLERRGPRRRGVPWRRRPSKLSLPRSKLQRQVAVQARGSRLTTIPERSQGARASSDLVNSSIRRPLIPTFGPSYTFVATDPTICCSVVVTNLRCLASCRYVRMVRVHAHCAFFCWFFYTPLYTINKEQHYKLTLIKGEKYKSSP